MKRVLIVTMGICLALTVLGIPAPILPTPGKKEEKKEVVKEPTVPVVKVLSSSDHIKYYFLAAVVVISTSAATVIYYFKPEIDKKIKKIRLFFRKRFKSKEAVERIT